MGLEQLDQLGEVGKRTGEAVDFVDHHDVDLARLNVSEQRLQGRAFQGAAGDAAVVIAGFDQSPTLVGLAFDIGLGSLALGIERVEVLLQAVLGGFPRVDGAAKHLAFISSHCLPVMIWC